VSHSSMVHRTASLPEPGGDLCPPSSS
jgi:hypothetical protein